MPTSMEAEKNPQQEPKNLYEWAKQGKWNKVVESYKINPNTHKVKITRSGDTALHIAVLNGQENIVEELVRLIDEAAAKKPEKGNDSAAKEQESTSELKDQGSALESKEQASESAAKAEASALAAKEQATGNDSAETPEGHPLKIANERGDTALHLAASIGNVRMCDCIAQKHKDLVGARNKLAETPLFLAALHGKKDGFLCLHKICGPDEGSKYCRKNDGETILHCAIAGEYFDLAYQIIDKYGTLVDSVNEEGLTPLHLLASIYVKKLGKEELPPLGNATSNDKRVDGKCPMNYQPCMNFRNVLIGTWNVLTQSGKKVNSEGGQTTSQNQDVSDENLKEQTNNCLKGLWSIISKIAATCTKNSRKSDPEDPAEGHASACRSQATCRKNSQNSDNQVKPNKHALENPEEGNASASPNQGARDVQKIRVMKEKHMWCAQIMKELLHCASPYEYDYSAGSQPELQNKTNKEDLTVALFEENEQKGQKDQKIDDGKRLTFNMKDKGYVFDVDFSKGEVTLGPVEGNKQKDKKETPILIAAKNGITEMVMEILDFSPVAIHDKTSANKNIVMVAVENRQPNVYNLLLEKRILIETLFNAVDVEGNSALHLVAMATHHQPWLIPGAALQMQWEIKWYKYVEDSMPMHFSMRYNKANKTARQIFTEKHEELVKNGSAWLNTTSNSCSVVAALIATVAFATSATVPGGINEGNGTPTLERKPAFNVFSMSSLIALCFSVNSLVMFLAVLTSRHQERDFGRNLPNKMLFGLSSLFISIGAMLVSFCAGHFFLLKDELKYAAFPIYAVTCLPVAFFAVMQFPLYLDLMWATFRKVPKRSSTAVS
ncbi:hypothetical protein AAG906_018493 [Vitis piasezkii]